MGAVSAAESALAGIGIATSLIGRQKNEQAQKQAIELRLQQEEAGNVERSTQRARRLNEVMSSQVAREGASGLALSSPSFFAVGRDSFDQFAEDENADSLNMSFDKLSAIQQEKSIKQQQTFGSIGDIFNAGQTAFNANVFKQAPKTPIFTPQSTAQNTAQTTPQPIPQQNQFPEGHRQSLMGELFTNTNVQDFIL